MTAENFSATNTSAVFRDGTTLPLFVNEMGRLVVQSGGFWQDHTKMPGYVREHIHKPSPKPTAATEAKSEEPKTPPNPAEDTASIADLLNDPNYIRDSALQYRVQVKVRKMKEAALA